MLKRKVTRKDYVKLLEENFELTGTYMKTFRDPRRDEIEKLINDYRDQYSVRNPKVVLVTVLVVALMSSLVMGVIIIGVINEILGFPVAYSLKNILVISCLFMLGKAKIKLFGNS